jgi:hypothetical protein
MKGVQTIIDPISERTAEQGSRTLVHAAGAGAGAESHRRYISNCKVAPVAPLVTSAVGCQTQNRVWAEQAASVAWIPFERVSSSDTAAKITSPFDREPEWRSLQLLQLSYLDIYDRRCNHLSTLRSVGHQKYVLMG